MGTWNAASNNFSKVWQTGEPIPKLPEELTKAWWDKKKSIIAKLTKATGVGAKLTKVEDAWKACNWGNYQGYNAQMTKSSQDIENKKYLDFIKSSAVAKLRTELKELRDLAEDQRVECTKSKIIPKDTATALEHIKSNAQGLNDAVNDNSLKGYLDAAIKKWRTDKLKAVVAGAGNQVTAAKLAVGNARTYVQQAKDMVAKWPLPQNYLSTLGTDKLSKACRNMNNPLAALIKAVDAGATVNNFDLGKAKVLQPKVSPYADDQAGNYLKGKDQNAMNQIITTISGYVDEFASLVNNAAVAAL